MGSRFTPLCNDFAKEWFSMRNNGMSMKRIEGKHVSRRPFDDMHAIQWKILLKCKIGKIV